MNQAAHRIGLILTTILVMCVFVSAAVAEEGKVLLMATTTSTDNTGLLDYLAPYFKQATGIELRWTATGTGKALKLGENCDVDVLMVHAPDAELKFVSDGFGVDRREIMYNDFVIIGPAADEAGIKGKSVKEALTLLKDKQADFISRGDNSGTNKKEIALWKAAGLPVPEKEKWYVQTGQGMLASINIAAERNGYTLTDRGLGQLQVGAFWRMGNNQSTTLTTPVDLTFGSIKVPKGAYSLWLKRTAPEAFELVFNSQTGQWGMSHDAAKDVYAAPLKKGTLPSSVEVFTIKLDKAPKGGVLELNWGTTRLSAEFQF